MRLGFRQSTSLISITPGGTPPMIRWIKSAHRVCKSSVLWHCITLRNLHPSGEEREISELRRSTFLGRLIPELPTLWSVLCPRPSQSRQTLAWSGLGSLVAESLDICAAKDFRSSFGIDRLALFQILSVHRGNWQTCVITSRFLCLMTTLSCRLSGS